MKKISICVLALFMFVSFGYGQVLKKTTGLVKPVRKLVLYDEGRGSSFAPSGWMGDTSAIQLDVNCAVKPKNGKYCMKWRYDISKSAKEGWAGVYWQYPANNWGTKKGMNLTGYKKLSFWIKGETGKEVLDIKIGGIMKDFPDTCSKELKGIRLSKEWKQYVIDLSGCDLSNVVGGFCWAADSGTNSGIVTFYFDDIVYE